MAVRVILSLHKPPAGGLPLLVLKFSLSRRPMILIFKD